MFGLQPRPQRRKFKDFARNQYGHAGGFNHRSSRKPAPARRAVLAVFLAALAAVVVGTVFWFVAWGGTLRVTEIDVRGASPATEKRIRALVDESLAERILGFLPRTNVPLFDSAALESAIRRNFFLDSLTVTTRLPRNLTVEVKEKQVRAVMISGSRFLGLDASGFVVRDLTDKEVRDIVDLPEDMAGLMAPSLGAEQIVLPKEAAGGSVRKNRNPLPLCVDGTHYDTARPGDPTPGKQVFSPAIMELVMTAYSRLPDIAGPVRWFKVDEAGESVQATLTDGWDAYFTSALPFDKQGSNLVLVLKDKVKDRIADLLYIDLRYNERIFIKYKEGTAAGDSSAAPPKP